MLVRKTAFGKYEVRLFSSSCIVDTITEGVNRIMVMYREWEGYTLPEGAYNTGRTL